MSSLTEAILFLRDDDVVKEMYFSEFEAVLDDVVGVPDFAGEQLQAVFVQINGALKITGAVFFIISFDKRGRIAGSWNIPLRHLLDHANFGPDLGAGMIRVACRSACPVSWYRQQLWDPVMDNNQTFSAISLAVQRNRLGIVSDEVFSREAEISPFFQTKAAVTASPSSPTAASAQPVFHRRYRARLKALRQAEQLRLATQAERFEARQEQQAEQFSRKLADLETALAESENAASTLDSRCRQLQAQLSEQQALLDSRNADYEALLEKGGESAQQELDVLKASYQQGQARELERQAAAYEERLRMRETELYQRATEIVGLRDELGRLREQNNELMLQDDSAILSEMAEKGVVFVAFHPGIEHLVIDRHDMPAYLRDPQAYAAERCEVSLAHYQSWLVHYRLPVCCFQDERGEYCGQPLDKVMKPKLFRAGDSDRCDVHKHG